MRARGKRNHKFRAYMTTDLDKFAINNIKRSFDHKLTVQGQDILGVWKVWEFEKVEKVKEFGCQ